MSAVPQPSTEDVYAALAQTLLPLAGPYGLLASTALPAVKQLYDTLAAHPNTTFTIDDLAGIVAQGDTALAQLIADREKQKLQGSGT